jgi:ribosome-binding protein aMBF1 (putative translation factor)
VTTAEFFKAAVHAAIRAQGISYYELAKRMNIQQTGLMRMLDPKTDILASTMDRISDALNHEVCVQVVLGADGDEE